MDKFERLLRVDETIFGIYGKLLTIKRAPLLLKTRTVLSRNKLLLDQKKSDTCYIVGLGPSLKKVDLDILQGDMIVTNRFYKIDGANNTRPVAYVMCDNDFFNEKYCADFKQAVNSFQDTNFILNGSYIDNIKQWFPNNDNFYYLLLWDGFISEKTKIDCTKVLPMSSNVICTAIMVALFMGYKRIYLLGCDFNSFASNTAIHAYKEENKARLWTMSNELFQYSFAADMHMKLDSMAKKRNQEIINATVGSLIDAYRFDEDEMKRIYKD